MVKNPDMAFPTVKTALSPMKEPGKMTITMEKEDFTIQHLADQEKESTSMIKIASMQTGSNTLVNSKQVEDMALEP